MANKIIQLTANAEETKTSLEVYRDLSFTADLNQANILKTYKEIVPTAYLANNTVVAYIDELEDGEYVAKTELSDVFSISQTASDYLYQKGQYVVISNHIGSNVLCSDTLDLSVNWKCMITSDSVYASAIAQKDIEVEKYEFRTGELTNVFLQGETSAFTYSKLPFLMNVQYDTTRYEEVYGDTIENYVKLLRAESSEVGADLSAIITEETVDKAIEFKEILTLLQNEGAISSFNNWKELQKWNPYKLAKLVNVKAVFNSIHNIFSWIPGERILNPEFGTKLRKLLYEGITEFNTESIIAEIRRCISEYEPRVRITNILNSSTTDDTENNTIQIDIIFTIPSLSEEQFKYSYTYEKVSQE